MAAVLLATTPLHQDQHKSQAISFLFQGLVVSQPDVFSYFFVQIPLLLVFFFPRNGDKFRISGF